MSRRAGSLPRVVLLGALLGGCLNFVPADDDDSGDDDDTTVADDDDDTTVADDDDSTPAGPVDQAAEGAVAVIQYLEGGEENVIAVSVLAEELLEPSALEAAIEEGSGTGILTSAVKGRRDVGPDGQYDATFLQGPTVSIVFGDSSTPLAQGSGEGRVDFDIDPDLLSEGGNWTAQIGGTSGFAGFYEAPALPPAPRPEGDRLLGYTYFLTAGDPIRLTADADPAGEDEVFTLLLGDNGASRGWPIVDGVVDLAQADHALDDDSNFVWTRTRHARVETDDGPLLVSSGNYFIGDLEYLGTTDVFLEPVEPKPGELVAGQVLSFQPEPPLSDPTFAYAISIGGVTLPTSYAGGRLDAEVVDPTPIPWGWQEVATTIPGGGIGLGSIKVGRDAPPCDRREFGSNDAIGGANGIAIGQVVCGDFDPVGDQDTFRFDATAGITYDFALWSERLGESTDGRVQVVSASGGVLASATSGWGADPLLTWTATSTGTVYLRVSDLQGSGVAAWRLETGTTNP